MGCVSFIVPDGPDRFVQSDSESQSVETARGHDTRVLAVSGEVHSSMRRCRSSERVDHMGLDSSMFYAYVGCQCGLTMR